ncbi:HAMP domain-containing protein [Sagittula sp. NFXS13]|uniref:methyl-accepting chemotaxis protein n=1 Tax=Sagittula sp. NFXS13 TaxID=2819095 RepID=UPI0032DF3F88
MSVQDTEIKRKFVWHSIFVRCALLMAATTIVVAGVLSAGAMQLFDRMAVSDVNRQAEREVARGLEALQKPLRFQVADKIEEESLLLLQGLGANAESVIVLNADGNLVSAHTTEGLDAEQDTLIELGRLALAGASAVTEQKNRLRAAPVMAGPEGPVIGALALASSYEAQRALVWQDARWIFVLAGVSFVVMMGLTLWLLNRTLGAPLRRLTRAVKRIIDGDYDTESKMVGRKDEIGDIARNTLALLKVLREGRTAEQARAERLEQQLKVVGELGQALDNLANGILHMRIAGPFPKEYEALRANYNRAVEHLCEVVTDVKGGAEGILASSDQIASASDDLSRRTETQAATLEQSAAAMEEMLAAVKSAARNASDANTTMSHTRETAEKNGQVMKSAIIAMKQIEKSSDKISEITSVIDDIAFQTNLLALNAGVEAARAGESGKGFAVVASEVRGLAQRSAEAAQQIKELILGSGERVKQGVHLVEASGLALEDVLAKIADVSAMVEQIASSAEDQAQGLNEINEGISNLDRVTQQNAAMVEESNAASQMLQEEANRLSKRVAGFETDSHATNGPAREQHAA